MASTIELRPKSATLLDYEKPKHRFDFLPHPDLHTPPQLKNKELLRRRLSLAGLHITRSQPEHAQGQVLPDGEQQPDPPPPAKRRQGASKSFSNSKAGHLNGLRASYHAVKANAKQKLQTVTTSKKRASSHGAHDVPMLQRTRSLFGMRPSVLALTTLDDEEKGAVTERKGDTESNVESVLWTQYSGAAARQSARDFGKPVGPRRSRDDSALGEHRRESPQNRESGISLAAEFENLRVDDVVKGEPVPDIPRYDPSKRLPTELSYAILSHLDIWELVRCERVSKRWRRLVLDPSLRRQEFMSNWAANSVDGLISSHVGGEGIGKANTLHQNWTKMYRARQEMERRWREGPNNELTTAIYLNGHTDSVYCVQFDEHKVITGSRDRTFRIWDAKTGELRLTVGVPNALESDRRHGSRISTQEALSGPMRVVNRPAGTYCAYKVPDFYHNASILCLQFDDELLVTGSSDHSLIMWDIRNYQPIRRLQQHTAGVLDITFDKQKIVSCSKDGTICIWDRATGKLLSILSGHRGPVNAVQMRGNRIVTASGEGIAKLWELDERGLGTPDAEIQGRCLREFRSKDRGLACVEFSADGRFVMAGGNDKVIYKFDARTGQLVEVYKGHKGLVRSLYLDQPNRRLVTGSYDNELKCWDYVDDNGGNSTGSERWGLSRWATSWILSAKGDYRRLVTTSQDGRALLLDFGTGIPGAAMLEA